MVAGWCHRLFLLFISIIVFLVLEEHWIAVGSVDKCFWSMCEIEVTYRLIFLSILISTPGSISESSMALHKNGFLILLNKGNVLI